MYSLLRIPLSVLTHKHKQAHQYVICKWAYERAEKTEDWRLKTEDIYHSLASKRHCT